MKGRDFALVTVAAYEHKHWVTIINNPDMSCEAKQALAFATDRARLSLDARKHEGWVTLTERNWYRPVLYYVAVMDCGDEINQLVGDTYLGKVEVRVELKADDDQLSYEQ